MANTYTQIHYKQLHSVPDGTAGCGIISISTNILSLTGQYLAYIVPSHAGLGGWILFSTVGYATLHLRLIKCRPCRTFSVDIAIV